MSRLSVYWPEEGGDAAVQTAILPFPDVHRRLNRQSNQFRIDIVGRAQALFNNRTCPHCAYPVVEPLELADGLRNRNNQVIPGTATLVGFRCTGCDAEWPA